MKTYAHNATTTLLVSLDTLLFHWRRLGAIITLYFMASLLSLAQAQATDLTIRLFGPTTVSNASTITYTIEVVNAGPSAANFASIQHSLPIGVSPIAATCSAASSSVVCGVFNSTSGGYSGNITAFPAFTSATIVVTGRVPGKPLNLSLASEATIATPLGVSEIDAQTNYASVNTLVSIQNADVSVSKTQSSATLVNGQTHTYTVTYANNGPGPADGVTLNDALTSPVGAINRGGLPIDHLTISCLSSDGSPCPVSSSNLASSVTVPVPNGSANIPLISAQVGSWPAGVSYTYVVKFRPAIPPDACGASTMQLSNVASVTLNGIPDTDTSNNAVVAVVANGSTSLSACPVIPTLGAIKTQSASSWVVGSENIYTVKFRNTTSVDIGQINSGAFIFDQFGISLPSFQYNTNIYSPVYGARARFSILSASCTSSSDAVPCPPTRNLPSSFTINVNQAQSLVSTTVQSWPAGVEFVYSFRLRYDGTENEPTCLLDGPSSAANAQNTAFASVTGYGTGVTNLQSALPNSNTPLCGINVNKIGNSTLQAGVTNSYTITFSNPSAGALTGYTIADFMGIYYFASTTPPALPFSDAVLTCSSSNTATLPCPSLAISPSSAGIVAMNNPFNNSANIFAATVPNFPPGETLTYVYSFTPRPTNCTRQYAIGNYPFYNPPASTSPQTYNLNAFNGSGPNTTGVPYSFSSFMSCTDMVISKNVSKAVLSVGEAMSFSLVISNAGGTNVAGATLKDIIPAGFSPDLGNITCSTLSGSGALCPTSAQLAAASNYQTSALGSVYSLVLPNLAPGNVIRVTMPGTATAEIGSWSNVAEIIVPNTLVDAIPATNKSVQTFSIANGTPQLNKTVQGASSTRTTVVTPGSTFTYTLSIQNPAAAINARISSMSIQDALSVGFTYVGPTSVLLNNATRTNSIDPSAGNVNLSWGQFDIDSGGSVILSFVVRAPISCGSVIYNNSFSINYTDILSAAQSANFNGAVNGRTADDVVVACPPSLTKSFEPNRIKHGETAYLKFIIQALDNNIIYDKPISFKDDLPADLETTGGSVITNCTSAFGGSNPVVPLNGASASLFSGATSIYVVNAYIPVGSPFCSVSVPVRNKAYVLNPTCSASSTGFINGSANMSALVNAQNNVANTCLEVFQAPANFSKSYLRSKINSGDANTLTFSISNTQGNPTVTVNFTDVLPDAVTLSTPLSYTASAACLNGAASGVIVLDPVARQIRITGLQVSEVRNSSAGSGSCLIDVGVTNNPVFSSVVCDSSSAVTNFRATNIINTTNLNTSGFSSACFAVGAPSLSKFFSPSIIRSNTTSTLVITLNNVSSLPAQTSLSFTDNLASGLVINGPVQYNTCGGTLDDGQGNAIASGATKIRLVNGVMAQGVSSCQIGVPVTNAITNAVNKCASNNIDFYNRSNNFTNLSRVEVPDSTSACLQVKDTTQKLGLTKSATPVVRNPATNVYSTRIILRLKNFGPELDTVTALVDPISGFGSRAGSEAGLTTGTYHIDQATMANTCGFDAPSPGQFLGGFLGFNANLSGGQLCELSFTLKWKPAGSTGSCPATGYSNSAYFYSFSTDFANVFSTNSTSPPQFTDTASVTPIRCPGADMEVISTPISGLPAFTTTGLTITPVTAVCKNIGELAALTPTCTITSTFPGVVITPVSACTVSTDSSLARVEPGGNLTCSFNITMPSAVAVTTTSTITVTAVTNAQNDSLSSNNSQSANLVLQPAVSNSISGNVYNDTNGLNGTPANTVDGVGTATSAGLNAVLLDSATGQVITVTAVTSTGAYSFTSVQSNTTYTVILTTGAAPAVGSTPTPSLPAGWTSTGENIGAGVGSDGVVNTRITVGVTSTNVVQVNFGIEQPPIAGNITLAGSINLGGSNTIVVPVAAFIGAITPTGSTGSNSTDTSGLISAVTITSFPTNVDSITLNGVTYTSATFPATGVSLTPAQLAGMTIDPINGNVTPVINYTATDEAGKTSALGTVTLALAGLNLSGNVYNDINGLTDSTVNGVGTNAGGLSAVLVNSLGNVASVTAVASSGVYSFTDVISNTSYTVVLTTANPAVGSAAPVPSLPAGWTNTGENIGASSGNDGSVNGSIAVGVTTASVVNLNFGIEQPPIAGQTTATVVINPGGTATIVIPPGAFTGALPTGYAGTNATDPSGSVTMIKITAMPTGADSIVINGVTYTSASFPVAGVTASISQLVGMVVDPSTAATAINIQYVAIDAADKASGVGSVHIPLVSLNITGKVYLDHNRDGSINGTDSGISGITVTLCAVATQPCTGSNILGTTTSNLQGEYTLTNAPLGTYYVQETQPAGYGSSTPNVVTVTLVTSNAVGINFADTLSSLGGLVYRDDDGSQNRNGVEPTMPAGITITLTGTDVTGAQVTLTIATSASGTYIFDDLKQGNYTVSETQPTNFGNGAAHAGTTGGTGQSNSNVITAIPLPAGADSDNNNFGDVPKNGAVSGSLWRDNDHDKIKDPGEPALVGWTVQLYREPVGGGTPTLVATTVSDGNGAYSFIGQEVGLGYSIRFVAPGGAVFGGAVNGETGSPIPGGSQVVRGELTNLSLQANITIPQQSLPVDPSGVVYDSDTRLPVPGAQVGFAPIGACPGYNPVIHLVGGVPNANQVVGADGFYQFLLNPGSPACQYGITVTPPAGYLADPGVPPQPTPFTPPNRPPNEPFLIVPNANAPQAGEPTTWYQLFNLNGNSRDIASNHIPLVSRNRPVLFISKVAGKSTVELGDNVKYTVKVKYVSGGVPLPQLRVVDSMPAGFKLIAGTSFVSVPTGATAVAIPAGNISGAPGAVITYNIALPAAGLAVGQEIELTYRVRVGVGSLQGDGINRARAFSIGVVRSNIAQAKVKVNPGVFTSDACIVGKIYTDCNNNHVQDAEEVGVPGVRLYMQDGTYLVSDSEGKYSICGLEPKSHVLKVDQLTLPRGARLTTTSNRNLGNADSLWLDLKNGEMQQADFAIGSCSNTVLEQVKARRAQGGVRSIDNERKGGTSLKFEGKSANYPDQGTDGANQPLVQPRPPGLGASAPPGAPPPQSNAENNTPVPQLPAASSNTPGNNIRLTK
jgi:large repetitive protein